MRLRNYNRTSIDITQYFLVFSSNSPIQFIWQCNPDNFFYLGSNRTVKVYLTNGTIVKSLCRKICELFISFEKGKKIYLHIINRTVKHYIQINRETTSGEIILFSWVGNQKKVQKCTRNIHLHHAVEPSRTYTGIWESRKTTEGNRKLINMWWLFLQKIAVESHIKAYKRMV